MQKKIRVAVLYGGRSGEHEVSLVSAANVIQNLDRSRFDVVPIGIDKQGGWFLGDDVLKKELSATTSLKLQREAERMLFNPDCIGKSLQQVDVTSLSTTSETAERMFDVVFPVIHGPQCEDGTIQGMLETADLPYVGCGVLSSAVGMDKDISKRLVQNAGMSVPAFVVIKLGQWNKEAEQCLKTIEKELTYPMFVKPANTGSSVGVHKVKNLNELRAAILDAFKYDTKLVIEQGLDVLELEIAVLESTDYGADPIVSVVGEVKPTHEFYSYTAKYLDENGALLGIPADISPALQAEAREFAKNIFNVLECEGMARVDLFLERGTNKIYFNEVNTIPGFTQISMYPKLMAASGIDYSTLLTHLLMLAVNRQVRKNQLSREFVG